MPLVTQISEQKRRPNRRNVYLDGAFAFGCNLNVVAKFRLREGMTLTDEQVRLIQLGEVRQECFDRAMEALGSRLHSRAELRRKLLRREYGETVVNAVLDDLARLGYVNDEQFAKTKALSAAEHKHHGRRRAFMELRKAGVNTDVAERRWPTSTPSATLRPSPANWRGSSCRGSKARPARRPPPARRDAPAARVRLRLDPARHRRGPRERARRRGGRRGRIGRSPGLMGSVRKGSRSSENGGRLFSPRDVTGQAKGVTLYCGNPSSDLLSLWSPLPVLRGRVRVGAGLPKDASNAERLPRRPPPPPPSPGVPGEGVRGEWNAPRHNRALHPKRKSLPRPPCIGGIHPLSCPLVLPSFGAAGAARPLQ